jgi:hypothetical protein
VGAVRWMFWTRDRPQQHIWRESAHHRHSIRLIRACVYTLVGPVSFRPAALNFRRPCYPDVLVLHKIQYTSKLQISRWVMITTTTCLFLCSWPLVRFQFT